MVESSYSIPGKPAPLIRFEPKWSPQQKAIFRHVYRMKPGDSLIVEAVAGSGKTTTAVEALRYTSGSALMLAFARSNVADMREMAPEGVEVRSAHSLCLKMLRDTYGDVQVERNRWYELAKSFRLDREGLKIKRCLGTLGYLKNIGVMPDVEDATLRAYAVVDAVRARPSAVSRLVAFYRAALKAAVDDPRTVDFDDMIWLPYVLKLKPRYRYDWILLDEAQDLNLPQIYAALSSVKAKGCVLAFGDSAQSLYGFRGIAADAMAQLGEILDADHLPLSVSFRCSRAVGTAAQRLVKEFSVRSDAEAGSLRYVDAVSDVIDEIGPGDAVLSRTNAALMALSVMLAERDVPFNTLGSSVIQLLKDMVGSSTSPEDLLGKVEAYRNAANDLKTETMDLGAATAVLHNAEDLYEGVTRLVEGASSMTEIAERLDRMCLSDRVRGDAVNLSTVHRAKGLEFDRVWILDWTFFEPSDTPDGRNLRYVAVTRARKDVTIVKAMRAAPDQVD